MSRTRLLLIIAAAFVAAFALLLASESLPLSSEAARSARARLDQPTLPGTGDAFAEFWFARRDVPPELQAELLASDIETLLAANMGATAAAAPMLAVDDPRYPEREGLDPEISCTPGEMECVAKARVHRVLLGAELRARASTLAAAERVALATGIHVRGPAWTAERLLEWPGGRVLLNAIALQFAEGAHAEAEDRLCRHVSAWRRLRAGNPHLRISQLALPLLADAAAIHAEMRAELPATAPVPDACLAAFAVLDAAETDLCPIASGEWQLAADMIQVAMPTAKRRGADHLGGVGQGFVNLLTHEDHTLDLLALRLSANACAGDHDGTIACPVAAQLVNPFGCAYAESRPMRQAGLAPALADLDRRFRLLQIARAWSGHADEATRGAAIRDILGAASPPPDALGYDADRRSISIPLLDPEAPGPFTIYLPGTFAGPE